MANWASIIDTEYNIYPNLTVYKILTPDDTLSGWRVLSNNGYVMYDTTAEDIDWGTMLPVTYYYTRVEFPTNFNFDNFTWVAVPRSEVDENYIFGTDEPEHEVM